MHDYCSMCICYFINFRLHLFFSLFSVHNQRTQFSSLLLLFPQMHTNKHTHTHTHTQTHPHTNTPTHKQTHTDKPTERQIRACGSWSVLDRSSWVLTDAWSEFVGLDRCLTGARLDRCLWNDRSSWVFCLNGACGSWSVLDWSSWVMIVAWLELVLIGACGMIGARGSFAWTELDWDGSCLIGAREIWPRGRVDLCWYRDW